MKISKESLRELLSEDNFIKYNKAWNKHTGGMIETVILQQMFYWHEKTRQIGRDKFYKFIEPCNNKFYKKGDSWTEELAIKKSTFRRHLKNIAFKRGQTKNKIKEKDAFIVYYTKDGLTYWWINEEKFYDMVTSLASTKLELTKAGSKLEPATPLSKTTTEIEKISFFNSSSSLIDNDNDKQDSVPKNNDSSEELQYETTDSDGFPTKKPEKPAKKKAGGLKNRKAWSFLNKYKHRFKYITGKEALVDEKDYYNAVRIMKKLDETRVNAMIEWYVSYDNQKFKEHPSFKSIFTVENINKFNLNV